MSIVGTRPEVVKLAPVIHELRRDREFESVVCATAQHRDMLDLAMEVFNIVPEIDLDLMQPNQRLDELTARVLDSVTRSLREWHPEFVLVQGDTTTAMSSALAAFYEGIPVGHVEAGLRTGDMANPFPEEMNRRVIGALATLHFAPTKRAQDALLREGVAAPRVLVTGNTVVDALMKALDKVDKTPPIIRHILVTAHRRESVGAPLARICEALRILARRYPELEIVYPVHSNPKVREPVLQRLSGLPNVRLIEPLGYLEFIKAMQDAYIILTDSGGVQEEAPSLGTPVLVMRDRTERPEALEVGAARLVGTDSRLIVEACDQLLRDQNAYATMTSAKNPFGDGHASQRIVAALHQWFGLGSESGSTGKTQNDSRVAKIVGSRSEEGGSRST